MNFSSKRALKDTLGQYNIKPLKGLGQNFLICGSILQKIIGAADLKPSDVVLEVGPGTGVLTSELAKRVKTVVAVEKDKKMAEAAKDILKNHKGVRVINSDILKMENLKLETDLKDNNWKLIANLPYYISSRVIRKFLENKNRPERMVLTVQKEVAQRICSSPPKMNLLAVSVQFYAEPKIISYVPANCFWPKPKVDSAIIRIKPRIFKDREQVSADLFFKVIKAGFSHPRKQIINNLAKALGMNKEKIILWLSKINIKPSQRAETLTIKDWLNLVKNIPALI